MSDKKEVIIKVDNLSVSYGQHKILENVNVSIPKGAILAVIGPNGSGKTTFLKVLLGLIEPTEGQVLVCGKPPKEVRNRVAYVAQKFVFDQTMPITVMEFLKLSLPGNITEDEYKNAMEHFKIKHIKENLLGTLSGGQLQRVLLARAFLQKPEILYLDEPEAGIDIGGERDFYEMIAHLNNKHDMTIIFVSHEVDIVSDKATHVLCLNKKHVCFGTPKNVLNQKTISKLYGTEVDFFNHKH